MTKQGELDYLRNIGEAGRDHSLNKPFSNGDCGLTLMSIGAVMSLMPAPPAQVLDLGCGGGWTSIFFAKRGYDVVGQDLAPDMIELAEEAKANQRVGEHLQFVVSDYESLTFQDKFDCAVFFDCLHHAEDEAAAIAKVFQALKPGGVMITHEPGLGHSTTPHSIQAMQTYGVNERDMPPSLIIAQAEKIGFRNARIYPMLHDLQSIYYEGKQPRLFSRSGWRKLRRLIGMTFSPSLDHSAIVVLHKPEQ
ncbi:MULTISPECIES: class I SAM-dependent methyltransferase [Sphingobium]|uniref:class I SAM-dependent methyltransferase n=1 Tax=Sphingobium TaxID=165695 RepID=UPI0015EC3266|nr:MULTISPECIES: class I SAM-dependent methyltransferase [Sphingobium]MCW2361399.1 2-polyprenyl-3-methyl-5-hydroxy-6-metoxy-1,4-benzoquinol methylase [Sphingobium sp. B10D3B]MCW2401922.1 2-polyprenyl-3-methyl-5-hydroxy-6-metoxy-1,4-benzoquinol methylase [Sphingobium sp. B10D7B]MCW2408901.1 2-polyprenyl-3-methyl-5-hydroxy-6-metoxy-1,4-benzoquinol methylase [Sphingobium xanthum]